MAMMRYFIDIKTGKAVLWCYLLWYLATVYFYFDPTPRLWLNSLGISAVIGTGLLLSVNRSVRDHWQTFRLYMMPFGVSSFSALIKGRGFFLIFSPVLRELLICIGLCVALLASIALLKIGFGKKSTRVVSALD